MNKYSKEIWSDNYRGPGEETVEQTWKRLATEATKPEKKEGRKTVSEEFYSILEDFKFIPGGRIMANLGINSRQATTLMNCYVHHPKDINYTDPDSIEGIYTMLKAQAHTLKSEGGYGTNFSWIRPAGTYVQGIGGRTPGVLKFMELWDKSSEIITMGSEKILGALKEDEKIKIRKGAQMGVLSVWHPEIEDYIIAKQTPGRLTKFNTSIGITRGFMQAVEKDKDWNLIFPDTSHPKYEKEWKGDIDDWKGRGYDIIIYKTMKAKDLWNIISYSTYTRNEPGVIFLDLFNKLNPIADKEQILATNPCGEIGMATGVCNLGSLNLTKFVKIKNDKLVFDFEEYARCIKIAVRFLDNINDISNAPLPEYKNSMITKRRIGLGNMGLGSLFIMFGIRYGSKESLDLIKNIYKLKAEAELLASATLGKEKGNFLIFDKKKYFNSYWWKNLRISLNVKQTIEKIGCMRNSHHSMNAPNGNTSIYAGVVTGGIEPPFMLEYTRWAIVTEYEKRNLRKKNFTWADPLRGEWFETEHMKFDIKGDEQILKGNFDEIEYEVDKNRGLVKATNVEDYGWSFAKNLYKDNLNDMSNQGLFASAMELSVEDHLNVLKIIAHYTNMNNSKTVNLPNEYSYEEFKSLYMSAWKSGIKGLTTYRAGTMTSVLEEQKTKVYQNELERQFEEAGENIITNVVKIPHEYFARGFKIKDNGKKKWYINLAFVDEAMVRPYAIFVNTNNIESTEVTEELINSMEKLLIKRGLPKNLIEEQIEKYESQKNTTRIARIIGMALRHNLKIQDIVEILDQYPHEISSFVFHMKKLLAKYIQDGTKVKKEKCDSCKYASIIYQDGCKICSNCGWSKC
jgi:ribonucleoside-diphosphate reductase alpha chain